MCENTTTSEFSCFDKLYIEYQKKFIRFANTYVRDQAVAEDIAIEALMYYWENRAALSNESNVPAYILMTIKNKCLNYLHHQQIHENYSETMRIYYQWELDTRIATLEACEPEKLFSSEIQDIVRNTLNKMPEKTRRIFMLHRYESKTYKEIAQIFNITTKGVDFHIRKVLKKLQTNLKDYCGIVIILF